jgi:C4-dicarboxylate transporter DctQ subunit
MQTPYKKPLLLRWIDYACDAGGVVAAVCLAIVTLTITYDVCMRYFFHSPTVWVQELSIYLCIAIGFLACGYALKNDSHFPITLVVDQLTVKNRCRLKILTCFLGMAYSAVFVIKGIENSKFAYDIGDTSTGLMATPLWIPWVLVPIGGLLLGLQFFNKMFEAIRTLKQG